MSGDVSLSEQVNACSIGGAQAILLFSDVDFAVFGLHLMLSIFEFFLGQYILYHFPVHVR
jgi:hypothetical protein